MEHSSIVNSLIALVGIFVTAFVVGWKNKTDKRLDKLENNYVKEFQLIRDAISNATIAQLQAMSEMEKRLSQNFVSRDLCDARTEAQNKI